MIYRVVIIPDTHIPFSDTQSIKAIENFLKDNKFDEWVHLGDLLDFNMISKFNADMLRKLESRRILKDYELANVFLDRQQELIRKNNKDAKFTLLQGNHEARIETLLDKAPQFEGLLEVELNLRLKDRGIKWVRSWTKGELYKIGKLHFHHGEYTSKYHASKMVDNYGVNMVYGHTHDRQSYGKTTHGTKNPVMATSLGHLANVTKLGYTRNKPTNWVQCFGIAEIRPDGNFNLTTIDIINHEFSYTGKTYGP